MAERIDIKLRNLDNNGHSVWTGYKNFSDITNMKVSDLAPGSLNVMIQDGDRIEPRAGIDYLGAPGTAGSQTDAYWAIAHRIHSKYDDFINIQGIKIPLRVFYSGTSARGDVVEAWLPTNGDVTSTTKSWVQITPLVPTSPVLSTHRYFFDQWWDRQNVQSRAIFTVGNNKIWTWTGGFTPITALTPTTIQTDAVWSTKGFIDTPEGNPIVVINGIQFTVTAGFGTDTITVASTAGLNVGDLVLQSIDGNDTLGGGTIYDVCSVLNNQAYYLDWRQRNAYVSYNRNQAAYLSPNIFVGSGLDDAIFSGAFTDTETATFQVTIDDVNPDIETQEFVSTGEGGLNNGRFVTSGYSGTPGSENVYRVLIVGDGTLALTSASVGGNLFKLGEVVTGSVSQATAQVVQFFPSFQPGIDAIVIKSLTGSFEIGDTVTGNSSGTSGTFATNGISGQDWIQYYKNDVLTTITSAAVTGTLVPISVTLTTTLTDGLTMSWGNYFGHTVGDYFLLTIREGGVDRFRWKKDNGSLSAPVSITGAAQALSDGVTVTFSNLTGHQVGDTWTITAYRKVERGWTVFTYTQPNRLPGEGFTLLLDSNGWTLKPQEDKMYINAQAGHWYQVDLILSSDLLNEDLTIKRLKSEPQNKALYPYLIGYDRNQIATISQDISYDVLGRQEFLELPQTKSISDEIRVDFESTDWEDGDFLYAKRKTFFVAPRSGIMFIWDDYKKYWHTPQKFAKRVGLVSIIDDKVCGHSYETNETYELFTGTSDLTDYGIETKMVFPYDSMDKRFIKKASSAIGIEGYIEGAPEIFFTVNAEVGGCKGQGTGKVDPFLCLPNNRASLGKSHLGFHGYGNDPVEVIPHFFYIGTYQKINYYQRNIELTCDSLDQRWSIISIGTDVDLSDQNNGDIVRRKTV